jgi:hypothetical protein
MASRDDASVGRVREEREVNAFESDLMSVQEKTNAALSMTQGDPAASAVLTAVVREFATKADKALKLAADGRGRDAVLELEQAGDSAKAAAEADDGATEATRSSVLDAHLAICVVKAGLDSSG